MLSIKSTTSRTFVQAVCHRQLVRQVSFKSTPQTQLILADKPCTPPNWNEELCVDYSIEKFSEIHFLPIEKSAVLPFDPECSENNLAIIAAMEEVLSNSDPDISGSKKYVFLHLIKSIQNEKLFSSVREKLVMLITALNDNKAFVGINLSGLDFSGVVMVVKNVDLSGATIRNAKFVGADFTYTNFATADMTDSDFTDADFRNANLNLTNLSGVCFLRAQFVGANMSRCILPPLWTSIKLSSRGMYLEMLDRIDHYRKNGE